MILEKWLCDMKVRKVKTRVNLDTISTREGDFVTSELSRVVNTYVRNRAVVETYKQQSGILISFSKKPNEIVIDWFLKKWSIKGN
jgi:hypothetical protein